jgi:uncharacterized protein YndB with AHSA1/START domain
MPTNEYGTVVERDGNRYLRFRRTLAHPVQKVWDALVDPDQMIKWLAEQKRFDPRAGGDIELAWTNGGPEVSGKITAIDPPYLLEHTLEWSEDGTMVQFSWQLEPTPDGGTVLTFEHEVHEPFERKDISGWHSHLDLLEEALDGGAPEFTREAWEEIDARYAERMPDVPLGFVPPAS